jgi:hypothetical protein
VLAILVLGWNEFMALLWNPLYLVLVGVAHSGHAYQYASDHGEHRPLTLIVLVTLAEEGNSRDASASPPHTTPQGLFLFLFGRTLYYELDVDGEMQKGSLPAAISIANKLVPASKAVVARTVEAVQVDGVVLRRSMSTSE